MDSNGLIIQTFREPVGKLHAGFLRRIAWAFGPRLKLEVDKLLTTIRAA
jgi:hypothetical protein